MKLFLKLLAGFLVIMILLITGLNLYFTDERLRTMIMPYINEAVGHEVKIDRMSLTFFRSFPQFGLQVEGFMLPDKQGDPVMSLDELIVAVKLLPILRNEINIRRLDLIHPQIYYTVYEDSSSNIDFLLDDADTVEAESEYTLQIPKIIIRDAGVVYRDELNNSTITMVQLDAEVSLRFAELIESTVDARLTSLSVFIDSTSYVSDLQLELQQTSTIDMENEILNLTEGTFSIRGLALNIVGSVSHWSGDSPEVDFAFTSSSDNFGELLRLAPPEFDEYIRDLETSGSFSLKGNVTGILSEEALPEFELQAHVSDGYLKNPDLQEPVRDVNFSLLANNNRIALEQFSANAADNKINASATIDRPFDDDAPFSVSVDGDVDLATISRFYPIDQFGVEQLAGLLAINGSAEGNKQNPKDATFSGVFSLTNGTIKYVDVPHAIDEIFADIEATQDLIQIRSASLSALENRFSINGTVANPTEDQPVFDISAEIDFDLADIKDFYPIDEDTLAIRGQLKAGAQLRGQADQIEKALQQGQLELRNGYIAHASLGKPLEDITFIANASNTLLTIQEGTFTSGNNAVSLSGSIRNYLDDERVVDLMLKTDAALADISSYYSLEPWINVLTGHANLDLNVRGPVGDPQNMSLNGNMQLSDVNVEGDSLSLPVTDLQGNLNVTPLEMNLTDFSMNYGVSDFQISGRLQNYLGFMHEHESEATMPALNGSYSARLLNLDEMIDWEDDSEEPFPIHLPKMVSNVSAEIDSLLILGVPFTQIQGNGRINPEQIIIEEAEASLFDGTLSGQMIWSVPQPDRTNIRFRGKLHELTAESLFSEYPILGKGSRFHEYVSGAISADVDYYTEMNDFFEPNVEGMEASGSFGMTRSRLQGHPVQEQLATWLKAGELSSLALDEWTATFTINESVLSFSDFRLTSENIGIELTGTQHLITDEIDFTAQLMLPGSFRSGIASVISSQAVDALSRDDGIIIVPVQISGTMSNPKISPRQNVIEEIVQDKVLDKGKDVLRRFLDRNE